MHELGIANSIVKAVRAEALRRPGARVRKVGLRLGELAGVDRDALSFCFETLIGETDLAGAKLEVEFRPRRHRCCRCAENFVVVDYQTACPRCGNRDTECVGGEELELCFLELEEP